MPGKCRVRLYLKHKATTAAIAVGIHKGVVIMAGFPSAKKGNRLADKAKRPHPGIALDKNVIGELIIKLNGNVSKVAESIGSCRGSISQVIERHTDLQELLKQSRERRIDDLEDACWRDAIEHRDTALRCFMLKTQARHRGYDQDEAKNTAKDIAHEAFKFIAEKASKQ